MKNIAGNDVSIFLFRFELRGYGIDFVLNKERLFQDAKIISDFLLVVMDRRTEEMKITEPTPDQGEGMLG